MRGLIGIVIVAALLWSGWWWLGATALDRGLLAGVERARSDGWSIAFDDLSVDGFPNRFDTTMTGIDIAAPDGSVAWQAPILRVFALSYRPNHVIAVAPPEQVLRLTGDTFRIGADDLRGSAVVSARAAPDLRRATLVGQALRIEGPGVTVGLGDGQIALRETEGDAAYDLAVDLADIAVDGTADASITTVDVDAVVTLDRPIAAGAGAPPRLRHLDLQQARVLLDGATILAAGRIEMDHLDRPSGTLTLEADGWESLLDTAIAAGWVPAEQAPLLRAGLAGMAQDGRVQVPLTLVEGQVRLGAIPLGPVHIPFR